MAALHLFTLLGLGIISNVVFTSELNIKHNIKIGDAQKIKVSYANLKIIRNKWCNLNAYISEYVSAVGECFKKFLSCGPDCKSINIQVKSSTNVRCRIFRSDNHEAAGTCLIDNSHNAHYYYIPSPCDNMTCPPETHRCIPNYQQNTGECVHDLTVWSGWSECSVFCGEGKQTRDRTHRCRRERSCQGACKVSTMRNPHTGMCLLPRYSTCNPSDNAGIAYKYWQYCSDTQANFEYVQETGKLVHKCSNKTVCWKENQGLVISNSCPDPTSTTRFFRNYMGNFQLGDKCLGRNATTSNVELKTENCWNTNNKIDFSTLSPGRVKASAYKVQVQNFTELFSLPVSKYPGNPMHVGQLDVMDVPRDSESQFVVRIQTYFIAPLTGAYEFAATCAYHCKVYISANDQQEEKAEIISVTESDNTYQDWYSGEFTSTSVNLNASSRYYMEGIVIGKPHTLQHFSIGAIKPDRNLLTPITHNFLEEFK